MMMMNDDDDDDSPDDTCCRAHNQQRDEGKVEVVDATVKLHDTNDQNSGEI